MAYYSLLNFQNEPFSNTPDPRLFYRSRQHLEILQKLEIAIRLKRGLNLIIGDVGTGKTTLSRQLIRNIQDDEAMDYHLILDPGFNSTGEFLAHLNQLLTGKPPENPENETQVKEVIKNHLFTKSVEGGINTVLLIDEGQKLSIPILEALRELLNFETNDEKLLQIIIFAQNEFASLLEKVENFRDRINFQYSLTPLGFKESKGLIRYRINRSFTPGKARPLFTGPAFWAIYRSTMGSPRKMVNLCHQVILSMIIQEKKKADFFLVRSCVKQKTAPDEAKTIVSSKRLALGGLILTALFLGFYTGQSYEPPYAVQETISQALPVEKKIPEKTKAQAPPLPSEAQAAGSGLPAVQKPLHPVTKAGSEKYIPILSAGTYTNKSITVSSIEKSHSDTVPGYGKVIVLEDATVFRMIKRVYGQFSSELLSQLMASNPEILSPEHVQAGMTLFFPISEFAKPVPETGIFQVLMETRQFPQAFSTALSRELTKSVPVRILTFPTADGNFIYHVVLDHSFETRSQGLAFMKKNFPDVPPNFLDMVSWTSDKSATKGSAL